MRQETGEGKERWRRKEMERKGDGEEKRWRGKEMVRKGFVAKVAKTSQVNTTRCPPGLFFNPVLI